MVDTAFQKEMAALSSQSEELRAIEQNYRGNISQSLAMMLEEYRDYYRSLSFKYAYSIYILSPVQKPAASSRASLSQPSL